MAEKGGVGEAVTIVVASRDRPAMLRTTLEAVRAAMRPGDELLVVDSASRTPEVSEVAEAAGAVVRRCQRPGASLARNVGWRSASTALVAFTDDDCVPDPGWIEALATTFCMNPGSGFVTGRVVGEEGPRPRGHLAVSLYEDEIGRPFDRESDPSRMGHGANMAWRTDALARVGGFDEALGPGTPLRAAEDHDLFWRALRAGIFGHFEPAAVVRHRHWRSRREQVAAYHGYGIGSGALAVKQRRVATEDANAGPGRAGPARAVLWDQGLRVVGRAVRRGYEMAALAELAKTVGAAQGMRRAARLSVADAKFVSASPGA